MTAPPNGHAVAATVDFAAAAERYAAFYRTVGTLTTPAALEAALAAVTVGDVYFRDPFSDFHGRDRLVRLFLRMNRDLETPRFVIHDWALSGRTAYYRWAFHFRLRGRRVPLAIDGMSEVRFAADGRVESHIDHWDAASQVYTQIPVVGWLIERLRRQFAG